MSNFTNEPYSAIPRRVSRWFLATAQNKRAWIFFSALLLAISATIFSSPRRALAGKQLLQQAWTTVASVAKFKTSTPKAAAKPVAVAAAKNPILGIVKLNIARQGHAAIRLSDGRILLVGGENASGLIKESELYNPTTHQSLLAANLDTARTEHTASALPDGRILIVGGRGMAAALRSTEIYDPRGNTFTAGPNLNRPRAGHSATTLADGRILIAGGSADGSAEIYNPTTNSLTVMTGALNAARSFQSSVTLKTGKVLLVGGKTTNGKALTSAEVFDPATQQFTATKTAMKGARISPVLNLLRDGKVQVIGGGEETMEMYNATGNYFTAYAHLTNNAATLSTPGRAAFIHRKTAKKTAAARAQSESFAATATIEADTTDPLDRDASTSTDMSGETLVAGGTDSTDTTLSSAVEMASSAASVTTDKSDYSPGETATITGSGFLPNQTVNLLIERDPPTPATTEWTAQTDADGNFTTTYNVMATDAGVTFILTASQPDGPTAQTTFTDGLTINSFTVQNSTCTGGAISTANLGDTICGNANATVTGGSKYRIQWYNSATVSAGTLVYDDSGTGLTDSATSAHQLTSTGTWTLLICGTGNAGLCSPGNRSNATIITVGAAPTTTSISAPGITYNSNGSVTVSVSSGAGTPTGNVSLSVDGGAAVSKALASGSATFTSMDIAALGSPNAGNHTLSASYAAQGTFAASSATGTLVVSKATLTVTASSSTVTYGDAVPTITPSYSGFVGGQTAAVLTTAPTCTTAYTTTSNAGSSPATSCSGGVATNYSFSYIAGAVTVNKASLTVTASSPTVTYGDAVPTITPGYSGFVNGQNSSALTTAPTCTTVYTATSNADSSPATSCSGGGATNYSFTYVAGAVTVNKAGLMVTASSPTVAYGDVVPTITPSYSGFVNGQNASALTTAPTCTTTYTTASNAGSAPSTSCSGGVAANYSITYVTGAVTINKAGSLTTVTCPANVTFTGAALTPCSATVTGAGGLNQSLTVSYSNNTNVGTANASASYAGDANHNSSSDAKNFTIDKASSTTVITCPPNVAYDGTAQTPCTASVTGTGGLNQTLTVSYSNNTNAGTASANASYAGDANHSASSDAKNFTIDKAGSVTTVTCPASVTYTGSALTPCTANVTGAGGLNQSLTVSYANNVNAGTANASASYAGDGNHAASSDAKTFTIDKATSTVTLTCPASVIYNGSAQTPCTASYSTSDSLSGSLTVSHTNNTNAGTANASASYAGDANHAGSSDAKTFTIAKASSTTTVTCPASVTYNGSAQTPCSANVTGAGGLSQSLTVSYSNNTNAGTATANASFAGDANHDGSSDSKTFTISQATSTVTVTCPPSVTFNGSAQTPCTAAYSTSDLQSGSLSVTYSDNTNAGTASASATYAGDANHAGNNNSATFLILRASTTTTVTCPASVSYTGSAQTPCTATVTGTAGFSQSLTVSYSNNTNAGTAGASATFGGDANYTGSTDSKTFTINQATSSVTVTCSPTTVTYNGLAQTPCTASYSTSDALTGSLTVSYANNTNAGTATANATYAGDANHAGNSGSANFAIDKAGSTTAVTCPANVTYTGAALTPCAVSVTGAGSLSLTPTPTYASNTNAGTATASYNYTGDANHTSSSDSKNFTIDKASSTTVVTCPASVTYTGAALTPCSATTTGAGSLSASVTVVYANNTNAGTATADATYAGDSNHTGSTATQKTFTIAKASSTTTVTCPASVTYTGSVLTPCTANVTGAGGLSGSLSVSYANNINVGTATASASYGGDSNHNGSSDSKTFLITKRPSTLVLTGPSSVVYGNCSAANYSVTLTDTGTGAPLAGQSVVIKIGTQTVTVTTGPTGVANTILTLNQSVGTISGTATYAGMATQAGATSNTIQVEIKASANVGPIPGLAIYTGPDLAWTTSSTSSTATVTLSATIKDTDGCAGDIRTAKVTFAYRNNDGSYTPIPSAQNLPVGLVNPTDPTVGSASAIVQFNIGNQKVQSYTVAIIVGGNYGRNSAQDDTLITVAVPGVANSMVGDGKVDLKASPLASGFLGTALQAGTIGCMQVATNVTYNKSYTNPQGGITIKFNSYNKPDGTVDTVLHTYFIKSTAIATLVSPVPGTLTFTGKGVVQDITNPGTPISVDGGATVQLTTENASTLYPKGRIAVTVQPKSGGVWISSGWNGTQTALKQLLSGSIVGN